MTELACCILFYHENNADENKSNNYFLSNLFSTSLPMPFRALNMPKTSRFSLQIRFQLLNFEPTEKNTPRLKFKHEVKIYEILGLFVKRQKTKLDTSQLIHNLT